MRAALSGKDVVITSGTGSGKTEAFLLPVVARLVKESATWSDQPRSTSNRWFASPDGRFEPQRDDLASRPPGLRSIILYPMNALVDDQLVRLRQTLGASGPQAWLDQHRPGHRFWFGRYTNKTPVSGQRPKAGSTSRGGKTADLRDHLQTLDRRHNRLRDLVRRGKMTEHDALFLPSLDGSEMRSRWDMQMAPPDVMITNYSMLNVALMRDDETAIFEETRRWLETSTSHVFTLVVDEMHLYRGTSGSEVAYLVRRLRHRLGLDARPDQFRVIATTASLDWDRRSDREFVTGFFDKSESDFEAVQGHRNESAGQPLPRDAASPAPARHIRRGSLRRSGRR